ncbi:ABC transporter substrate-binding protein [Yoonia sp. 208BN28-4]|uniref:ABC transporter substrate-binding protein n=1 Tax=Yoonia sp. 208BN28-4 TaxID=3126505 RepID=UPI0030B60042
MAVIQLKSVALATAMLGLAAPAMAQNLCGGAGDGGQWIGGSEGASDIATAGGYQEQMALVLGGNEYVSLFTVSAPSEVRVEAEGRGAGDPLIDLIDDSGNIILSDDDSGGNGAARGEMMLEPGTYCMAMQSYDGAPMTAFVRIGLTSHEALTEGVGGIETPQPQVEPTDTVDVPLNESGNCSNGIVVGNNDAIRAGFSDTRSVDENGFYLFTLDSPMAVSITAENEDADPVVTLYDGAENYLGENDDYDGLNSRLDQQSPLPAGDYCISVTALNDTSLPITLGLSEYDANAALASLYDRGEAAPPLDGSVPVTDLGTLGSRLRQDAQIMTQVTWYSVNIDEPGLMIIEAISAGDAGDPWIIVYDDLGREVAQNDDYGNSLNSLVAARVNIGTYVVGVGDINDSTSNFGRLLFERYVPAR